MKTNKKFLFLVSIGFLVASLASCLTTFPTPEGSFPLVIKDRYVSWARQRVSGIPQEELYYHLTVTKNIGESLQIRTPADPLEAWLTPFEGSGDYRVQVLLVHNNLIVGSSLVQIYTMTAPPAPELPGPLGPRIEVQVDGPYLTWIPYGEFPQGFKIVWSKNPNPSYPPRQGDQVVSRQLYDEREHWLSPHEGPGLYYVTVFEYLGNDEVGLILGSAETELKP